MKMYEKPVVIVDAGMAEGVYAASGTEQNILNITKTSTKRYWEGDASGTVTFTISCSNETPIHQVTFTFNIPITGAWADGASNSIASPSATLSWYNGMPQTVTLSVTVAAKIDELVVDSYIVS